jgi:hypothetical protein
MGLCCQAVHSSFSLAMIIFVHMFVRSDRLAGGGKVSKLEQTVDSLNVPADCGRSRVVIEHELLHEACDDPLVSWLAATWVLNAMLTDKIQVHSLPKSCDFSSRI